MKIRVLDTLRKLCHIWICCQRKAELDMNCILCNWVGARPDTTFI